jgi:hypothetical protein
MVEKVNEMDKNGEVMNNAEIYDVNYGVTIKLKRK